MELYPGGPMFLPSKGHPETPTPTPTPTPVAGTTLPPWVISPFSSPGGGLWVIKTDALSRYSRQYLKNLFKLGRKGLELPEQVLLTEKRVYDKIVAFENREPLLEKVEVSGINKKGVQYDCFTTKWKDDVITRTHEGRGLLSAPLYKLDPGPSLYEGAYIHSSFTWQGFCSSYFELSLNDREIRGVLAPGLESIRGGIAPNLELSIHGDIEGGEQKSTLSYDAIEKVFRIEYDDASPITFYGAGSQAVMDWLDHFVQYFPA